MRRGRLFGKAARHTVYAGCGMSSRCRSMVVVRAALRVLGLTTSFGSLGCSTGNSATSAPNFGSSDADITHGSGDGGAHLSGDASCGTALLATGCACSAGEMRTCYTGPAATLGVGTCKAGTQTCGASQELSSTFGPCVGETVPSDAGACLADAGTGQDAADSGTLVGVTGDAGTATVLFGGESASGFFSDTWTWDGVAWAQRAVVGPSARSNAVMAPINGQAILFGGYVETNGAGASVGDTWTWDSAWHEVNVPGPPAREDAVMGELDGKAVLFGGLTEGAGADATLGDTWTWDGTSWTEVMVPGPPARCLAAMAPLGGKLVLFGGVSAANALLSDTWTWDGAAWAQAASTGPSARDYSVMASLGGTAVLFGGNDEDFSNGALSDTWTWDGTAWTQMSVSGPPGRRLAVMAPFGNTVVLFGGQDATATALSDTWAWDGSSWAQVNVSGPPARYWSAIATP